jgi:putative transposase
MSQSLAQIYLHVEFSTKGREPFLTDRDVRSRLHAYLSGTCRNHGSPSLLIGGVEDHIHLRCALGREACVSDLVRELKRESSRWLKTQRPELADFHWQGGYGAFSVSPSHLPALKRCIAGQEAHHHQETFQDKFRRLLTKYGVTFDERYVWD